MREVQVGTRYFGGKLTVAKSADPNLLVGAFVWLERKEPDFLRPMFRRRVQVIGRLDDPANDCVTYEFHEAPLATPPDSMESSHL